MVFEWTNSNSKHRFDAPINPIMFTDDKLEFLKGYLYNSPTHKDLVCWRALSEEHSLDNIGHILAAVDFEPRKIPFNPVAAPTSNKKHSYPITNYTNTPNFERKQYQYDNRKMIYEGCYNAHHPQTTHEIRMILNKIYVDLLEKKETKPQLKPANKHEAKLLNEYEKITSKIPRSFTSSSSSSSPKSILKSSSSSPSSSSEDDQVKADGISPVKVDYSSGTSMTKLEHQSLNKLDDELISNCDDTEALNSSSLSSSSEINFQKIKKKQQIKKVIPPRRKRNLQYLDNEKSTSDDYDVTKNPKFRNNKLRNQNQNEMEKSAFKKFEKSKEQEKTEEELITEFERLTPRNSFEFKEEERSKYDEIYKTLNSSISLKNGSIESRYVTVNSANNIEEEEKTKVEKNEEGPKINYQRASSPVNLKSHVMTLYPVQVDKKPTNLQQGNQTSQMNETQRDLKFKTNEKVSGFINRTNETFQYRNKQVQKTPSPKPKFKFLDRFSKKFIGKVNRSTRN